MVFFKQYFLLTLIFIVIAVWVMPASAAIVEENACSKD